MKYTTSFNTGSDTQYKREIAVGTIQWDSRKVEIKYHEAPNDILEVYYRPKVGCDGDYSTLQDNKDGFPVREPRQSLWNVTEEKDDSTVFISAQHGGLEWDERELYSGANLTTVAKEHFKNINYEQVIRKVELRLNELVQAISNNESSIDRGTQIYESDK